MSEPANFIVVEEDFLGEEPLVIKDVGPWDRHLTVTNDAENVVKKLLSTARLQSGQRLFYYDSAGQLDEIKIKDGRFAGFGIGPRG